MDKYIDIDGSELEIDISFNARLFTKNDKLHRLDGPAVEYFDGSRIWYKDEKSHRIGGPAICICALNKTIFINAWAINGKEVRVYYING